jgi:hypothetical protein
MVKPKREGRFRYMIYPKYLRVLFGFLLALSLAGCFSAPQWRVAQAKVPEPIVKSEKQIEAERQAADLIARKIETPVELKPVAQELSSSLGEPIKDSPKAPDVALAGLREGQLRQQAQITQLNQRLLKFQGKEIEGTGINLFAPATSLGVVGLIAACIFVPGFLTFVLFFIRRLFATIRVLVSKIQDFESVEPDAAAKLKDSLSRGMDEAHKAIVRSVKAGLVKEG